MTARIAHLVFAVVLGLSACADRHADVPDVAVTWQITPDPPVIGPATVAISLADSAGHPVEGADVDLEGIMTHPGMAPEPASVQEVAPGVYEAALEFSMRGDWVLLLEVRLPDGRSFEAQKEISGVQAP